MTRRAYLTVRDGAARAGCDPSYLRHEIAAGRLVATKVGRDWLIEQRDFAAWLANPRRGTRSGR
jgi:excisionase family DNA binding protein